MWLSGELQYTDDGIKLKDQSYWRKYAEHDLFPLFYYKQRKPTAGCGEEIRWKGYYAANQAFADKISENYTPSDTVLLYNYYLMLVPVSAIIR